MLDRAKLKPNILVYLVSKGFDGSNILRTWPKLLLAERQCWKAVNWTGVGIKVGEILSVGVGTGVVGWNIWRFNNRVFIGTGGVNG